MQKRSLLASGFVFPLLLFPALCSAQSISIVSGNGQLVCPNCPGLSTQAYSPLVVQVNDSTGNPVTTKTTVTWKLTQVGVAPVTSTSTTDTSGKASFTFIPVVNFSIAYAGVQVTATALNATANFVGTTVNPTLQNPGVVPVTVQLVPAASPPALTGSAGATATTSLQVAVGGTTGGLAGVQVRIDSGTAVGQPTVTCATAAGQQPGTVLTDATGSAICTPVFGSQIGSGTYTIVVGGNFASFLTTPFTVTPGPPAIIKIISGNNQSVNPGVLALLPLTAQVTDLGGNASVGAAVKWSVTGGTATLGSAVNTSNSNGQVTVRVTPTVGPVLVTVALANNSQVQAVFTVNVNIIITGISALSGTPQQASELEAFPDPLIVQVSNDSQPVAGVTVNFAVTSGSATLSSPSAVTDAEGHAQVTATAGETPGPVTVTATAVSSNQTYTTQFTLTVIPPGPIITSINNAAGFQDGFISPCSLATIFGSGLANGIQGVVGAFISPPTTMNNVSVTFGGVLAPILQMANVNGQEQLSVQVPCETQLGNVSMVVTANGAPSTPMDVTVVPVSPGIFETVMSDGKERAVLVRPDGSFVSLENPARRGETIRMFVTGLGQTTPALFTNEFDPLVMDSDGNLVAQLLAVNAKVVVGVNNGGVLVLSARYAAGMIGVYEVDFVVPEDTNTGNDAPFAIVLVSPDAPPVYGNGSLIPIQ